jgi:capsular exopolysaccharide synthesis family protein
LSQVDAVGFAEAYRSVRTALQFSTREGAPRQLVVTSTSAQEGKSTTALMLAINFAKAGHSVLLIDADLRNPSLQKLLTVDNSRGLSNFLSSDVPALGIVRTTTIPNLYVIPAGPLPPNPVELLSGPRLLGLLELSERFTHIIIDRLGAGIADALVLIIAARCCSSSPRWHAQGPREGALGRLRQAGACRSALMTKVNLRDGTYGYELSTRARPMCHSSPERGGMPRRQTHG